MATPHQPPLAFATAAATAAVLVKPHAAAQLYLTAVGLGSSEAGAYHLPDFNRVSAAGMT